jgi:hypothetical protein
MKNYQKKIIEIQEKIDRVKLLPVLSPYKVPIASDICDEQSYKCSSNLGSTNKLRKLHGEMVVILEKVYNEKFLMHMEEITVEDLKAISLVKSDKIKYIEKVLHNEYMEIMTEKNICRFLDGEIKKYDHWINLYKKTRTIPGNDR